MHIQPLGAAIGAEVSAMDAGDRIASEDAQALRDALARYALLVFREQQMTEEAQLRFTRVFGEPEVHVRAQSGSHLPGIFIVSNIVENGKSIGALGHEEVGFHSDLAYLDKPGSISTLYAVEVPDAGGDTSWCGASAAAEQLATETKRRLIGERAVHQHVSEELNPASPVTHPVLCKHPVTGRPVLFVTPLFTRSIEGMDATESDALLRELTSHLRQPEFIWTHHWRPGDLVVWDNRASMHSRAAFAGDTRRLMKRTQVFCQQRPIPWTMENEHEN